MWPYVWVAGEAPVKHTLMSWGSKLPACVYSYAHRPASYVLLPFYGGLFQDLPLRRLGGSEKNPAHDGQFYWWSHDVSWLRSLSLLLLGCRPGEAFLMVCSFAADGMVLALWYYCWWCESSLGFTIIPSSDFTQSNVFKTLTLLGHMAHRSGLLVPCAASARVLATLSPTRWWQPSVLLDKCFKATFLNVTVVIVLPLRSKSTLFTLLVILELCLVECFVFCFWPAFM